MKAILAPVVLLAAIAGIIACGDDDDSADPTGTVTPVVSTTPAFIPDQTGDGTVITPKPIENQEELEAEAADLCPADLLDPCSAGFLAAAAGDLPAALCVTEAKDRWFIETPGGTIGDPVEGVEVGDECAGDDTFKVVALLNYP